MSQGVQTTHGLKYTLSDEVFMIVDEEADEANDIWNRINSIIENAESLPSFVSIIVFTCFLCFSSLSWWMCLFIAIISQLAGTVLSHVPLIFRLSLLDLLLYFYHNILMRFFIPYILIILLSIIIKPWYAGIIFLAASLVLNFVLKATIDTYKGRESFNNSIARTMVRLYTNKS